MPSWKELMLQWFGAPVSKDVQELLERAKSNAAKDNNGFAGTDALLISLFDADEASKKLLAEFGITRDAVVSAVKDSSPMFTRGTFVKVKLTARVKGIVRKARTYALRDRRTKVEMKDVLHSLLTDPDNNAVEILRSLTVDIEELCRRVRR